MSEVIRSTLPARLVLGRARFHDRTKPDVSVFDVVYRDPKARLVADGLSAFLAEDFPFAITEEEAGRLLGHSFGNEVVRALPRDTIISLMERRGEELSEVEVRKLLQPLMRAATFGEVVIAGVPCPPSPDPQYVPFAPNLLPHWRFIPGQDVAEPLFAGSAPFMALRVFTPMDWIALDAVDRRLRVRPRESAVSGDRITTASNPVAAAQKGRGGRKQVFDPTLFNQEIVRIANGRHGIESRGELTEHMREWSAQHWKEPPSDEWVRQHVLAACPPEIPPD